MKRAGWIGPLALQLAPLLALATGASAADQLRLGKAVGTAFTFLPADVGVQEGIYQHYGIDLSIAAFQGDAKLQQAMASNGIDVGLGSGPAMAFAVKGSPVIAVAAFEGPPNDISITVGANSPIRSPTDLKGKLFAISTAGSLTDWLVKRVSLAEGWGTTGIRSVAIGDAPAQTAALLSHTVDGIMGSTDNGYELEERHRGRVLAGMETFVPNFVDHVIFVRKALLASNPDLVNRFLKGFFASVIYMKQHKDETLRIAAPVQNESRAVLLHAYDVELPTVENDGTFDPKGLALVKQSFVDMRILDKIPPDDAILTRQFLPVKP